MKKILAMGAHYDDVEIGVGGTLLRHVNSGHEVTIAITDADEFRTGDISMRYQEQLNSINMLGVDKNRLLLFKTDDGLADIIGVLDKLNFDVIYTMFEFDTHQAHRRCSHIGQAVGRDLLIQVIFYNSGTSYDFLPNIFSIISFDFKQKLLECFKSQVLLGAINIDIIQRRESYWASLITEKNDSYAEGLVVRKMMYEI